jgi:hypothetical protein
MKGLALCEAYFRTHGEPMLKEKFPETYGRIAAGLAGPGSECFGFDDEFSRDHDWGPSFCLWLADTDAQTIGRRLATEYARLPRAFLGFGPRKTSPGEEHRVGPCRTWDFFQTYLGARSLPETPAQWLRIPEESLATCTNGMVWADPLGEFTSIRKALLAYYPEDVRLKKIASRCITIAQAGQYNFPRSTKRGHLFAARASEVQFCSDVVSLMFLLNRRYTPYFKWAFHALGDLTLLGGRMRSGLEALLRAEAPLEKEQLMQSICEELVAELAREGLTDSTSDFLLDHVSSIYERIADPELRRRVEVVR